MSKRQNRTPLLLNDDELDAIAEFRWRNRIPSQAEAARKLIKLGLEKASESKEAETAPTVPAE